MMSKIQLLPQSEILKIAAGEVIQRPANIIKELVENALDANATNITVKILNGGKLSILVQDDGDGIPKDELMLAITAHATSKIFSINDLEKINTFGFRGEALASVASVSKLTITSKHLHFPGAKLTTENHKTFIADDESLTSQGTIIQAQDLFFNLPVRKKFLKSTDAESSAVWNTFCTLAVANKNVSFKYFEDQKLIVNAIATESLQDRIMQLFDYNLASNLLTLEHQEEGFKLHGLISNLQVSKYSRSHMFLFVNNRFFKDSKLCNAICNGYQGAIPAAKFPASFVFIETDQDQLDVNIHPAKEEIAFENHSKLLKILKESITKTLRQESLSTLSCEIVDEVIKTEQNVLSSDLPQTTNVPSPLPQAFFPGLLSSNFSKQENWLTDQEMFKDSPEVIAKSTEPVQVEKSKIQSDFLATNNSSQVSFHQESNRIIGQLFDTYILFERDNNFHLLDQHAASERIIYEKIKANFEQLPKNRLIFPTIIKLNPSTMVLLETIKEEFEKFGVSIEAFGSDQIIVTTMPPRLSLSELKTVITEIEALPSSDTQELRKVLFEHIHSHLACKTAIKAGDKLSLIEMENLIAELKKTELPFQCIHGRPTTFSLKKTDIEKWFKR